MFQALELSPGPATVEVRPAGIPAPFPLTTAVLAGPNLGEPEPHMHPEGMIMWPSRGSVVVLVEGAMRTLAVGQGIWVPPFTPHTMEVDASSTGCCTYFTPEVAPDWHSVGTVQLGAAFRELLLHLAESPMEVDQRLRAQTVVIELLPEATSYVETVPVPVPRDERLAPLVRRVLNDPADDRGVEAWAWHLSLSVRTIARIFAAEVGMTFSHWRTMVRMAAAARMLADDLPVGTVAGRVGYATTSAFSAAFRRAMGSKPSDWRP
ncbi:helix-turn-helix transcriptional regulator [Pseudoclavibacter helvolus]|uniref:helix-turn-helix transcriptional regulator n=1 Tax=Pseudoclavibacter helvolus TaxID=255205 RepID=UPI0008392ABC|nr:AraC family transcriptional regulator [Pseudoclavibacter helvolus]